MAQIRKGPHQEKSLLRKAADKVDHMLHPDHAHEDEQGEGPGEERQVKSVPKRSERRSEPKSKYEDHPKFAKFKKGIKQDDE